MKGSLSGSLCSFWREEMKMSLPGGPGKALCLRKVDMVSQVPTGNRCHTQKDFKRNKGSQVLGEQIVNIFVFWFLAFFFCFLILWSLPPFSQTQQESENKSARHWSLESRKKQDTEKADGELICRRKRITGKWKLKRQPSPRWNKMEERPA